MSSQLVSELRKSLADVSEQLRTLATLIMELKVFDTTTEDAAYLRGFREGRQKGFEEGQKSGFKFQDGFPPK